MKRKGKKALRQLLEINVKAEEGEELSWEELIGKSLLRSSFPVTCEQRGTYSLRVSRAGKHRLPLLDAEGVQILKRIVELILHMHLPCVAVPFLYTLS